MNDSQSKTAGSEVRSEFEDWACDEFKTVHRKGDGYKERDVHGAWLGFKQARATLSHPATQAGALQAVEEERDALRQALEVIAVGDSSDPVRDAGDELVALGHWSKEALDGHRAEVAATQPNAAPAAVQGNAGAIGLPAEASDAMCEAAMEAHYGARRVRACGGARGMDMTVENNGYNGLQAFRRMWRGAMRALAAPGAAIDARGQEVAFDEAIEKATFDGIMDRPCHPETRVTARAMCRNAGAVALILRGWMMRARHASRSEAPEARPNAAGQEQGAPARVMKYSTQRTHHRSGAAMPDVVYEDAPATPPLEAVGSSGMTADHAQGVQPGERGEG